ncbi:MAG: glycosyltransferase [Alphaproteobacteria bacterium]|nr:glycosyltransferase [Alphaproteobacteria bacterium]
MNLMFVVPIFNDWVSFRRLVVEIDRALDGSGHRASILAVDDGSSLPMDGLSWPPGSLPQVAGVEVAALACNLGHQKAIAVGLTLASKREGFDAVVVMDGDGEDDPNDLPRLLDALERDGAPIVMAHRAKRSEGPVFKVFYRLYKFAFRVLTGVSLSFGNYCALRPAAARRLAFMPNLWNSLPATCLRSKLPMAAMPTIRGRRYAGEPKMNFIGLILHGLQAITVFADTVFVRLSLASILVAALAVVAVVVVRFVSFDWVVPGWASNMVGFLALALLTVLSGLLGTSLLTLQERSNMPMIPSLHAEVYVQDIHGLYP